MNTQSNPQPPALEPVRSYLSARAFDDETPVDVSDAAREAGLHSHVAICRDAWDLCVALHPAARTAGCDEHTRLSDVLTTLAWAMERGRPGQPLSFEVPCIASGPRPTCIPLRAIPGRSGDAQDQITLVLPEEELS